MYNNVVNGLESSHDKIKKALKHKRLGLIEFLNECRSNLIEHWSRERSETIFTINPTTKEPVDFENLNLKKFHKEPISSMEDLLEAFKWNKLGKTIQRLDEYYMVRSVDDKNSLDLSREDCKQFLQRLENKPWTNFDKMISFINISDEGEKGIEEETQPSSKRIGSGIPITSSTQIDNGDADDINKCKICDMPLEKRKYFYCVNKCKQ
ncbi:unnamed protein product [Brachionus calyciflorus]|uniref:Uncharacterized protein n=1 Tax=Brachionus calyciflorus TaxID=104777 RepID=A0A814CR24_9BILA|nr:unnamed protein product [Brachionus calyciflorus]